MLRLPAEWEPQSAVMIAWPHPSGDFENLTNVELSYTAIAHTVSQFQPLLILYKDVRHQQHIQSLLKQAQNIVFIQAEYNDIWLRDTVFLTVEDSQGAKLLNFKFNGWGHKYPHAADNALNHTLLQHPVFKHCRHSNIDFILEGGSIESDGQGSLLTTENCLLNPNRNPDYQQQDITQLLQKYLGVNHLLWLKQNHLAGDDTDAHIDTLARFCNPDTIAYSSCHDQNDIHFAGLQNMKLQLESFINKAGNQYNLLELPLPEAIFDAQGQRLPANYANFLIINNAVLIPSYDDAMDDVARQQLQNAFPDRQIISIPCRPLVQQYGILHCMGMQFPATLELSL